MTAPRRRVRLLPWLTRILILPAKLLFGFDAFVSYSREDGTTYAEAFSSELGHSASIRIDLQETRPGAVLPLSLLLPIALSKVLVIVNTPRAAASIYVKKEVETFDRWSRGPVIPIEVGCPVESAIWWPGIAGVARLREPDAALANAAPSASVLTRVRNSIGFWRLSRRQSLISAIFAVVFALLSYFSRQADVLRRHAVDAANQASAQAAGQTKIAEAAKGEAKKQSGAAAAATEEAKTQAGIAAERRLEAERSLAQSYRARYGTQLEKDGAEALRLFETQQITGILLAMRSARQLEDLTGPAASFSRNFDELPSISPVSALIGTVTQARQRHEMSLREKDGDYVADVRWSRDGRRLAAGNGGDAVKVWEAATGREIATLSSGYRGLSDFSFSPDGSMIATCGLGQVKLWRTADGYEIASLAPLPGFFHSVCFSPNGRLLAVGYEDGAAMLWNVESQREAITLKGHQGYVSNVRFSPDGKLLATSGADSMVRLWEVSSGRELQRLAGHSKSLTASAFSPDGQVLASAGLDGTVILWQVPSGKQAAELKGHAGYVSELAFRPDSLLLATMDMSHTLRLWELPGGKQLASLPGEFGGVSFNPTGGTLATAARLGNVAFWDDQYTKVESAWKAHQGWFRIVFSPNGRGLATGGDDGGLKLWDIKALRGPQIEVGEQLKEFSPNSETLLTEGADHQLVLREFTSGKAIASWRGRGAIVSGRYSPDGRRVITQAAGAMPRFWDAATGREVTSWPRELKMGPTAYSPDGETMAVRPSFGGDVLLVGARSRKEIRIATGQRDPTADFDRSGCLLITRSSYTPTVKLWEVATGHQVKLTNDDRSTISDVSFNATGKAFATFVEIATESEVNVWDLRTLKVISKASLKNFPLYRAHLSPDGRVLAAERNGGDVIKLLDVSNGREIATLTPASKPSFSPNSRLLATSNSSGDTIRLWETATGREIAIFANQENAETLQFSADGRTLAMSGRNTTLKLWPTELGAWIESGCHFLESYLASHSDRNRYSMFRQDGTREDKLLCPGVLNANAGKAR